MANITLTTDIDYGTAFNIRALSVDFIDTNINILCAGKLVSGNNLLHLLALAAKTGTPCVLIASGPSEAMAIKRIATVLASPKTA
ncbi:MAG: HPr family phosphocarrier protein [Puniceicoccales bacterium]|jgi:phosphotransferase system HPr-like phosphotransfer protein|nr:HPr family phosphocarrier protein [Puniceicoccales bacterium]